ncbi:single-stranded-DNA-specific exonuclease RecJ [Patescibacteria group bacterium]|nr:single-stranded-DNA-specific exonuclease RecJ [Patescibacteria group bacterium]
MLNWKIFEKIDQNLEAKYPGVSRVILQLLINRGLSEKEEIDAFLDPKYENLHDPFLFRDMQKLVDRVKQARDSSEKVFVYGDYDADGVCSSIILVETLRKIGIKDIEVYIPHREKEGYGLNKDAIEYIANQGAKLLMTVDCGTSNVVEIAYAREKGIDVIILDHHEEPPELPKDVCAFLNPHLSSEKYPFKGLAAVGVAFKAVQALCSAFDLGEASEKWMLDLVAIATVADMMDLRDENRVFVKYGLVVLNKTQRLGLQALIKAMDKADAQLGVYEIGFMIAPRLNAAGRIEHANAAYDLLESQDSGAVNKLAATLSTTNTTRQSETSRILKEALDQVSSQLEENKVLVAVGDNWQAGVVGLVSGRITEKYHRPSLVIARTEKGLTGSGRSISGFNITQALEKSSEFLERFGGHEGACGFTLKSEDILDDFKTSLNKIADSVLSDKDLIKGVSVDMELTFDEITLDLVEQVEELAPFGMGNTTPKFASFGVRVENVSLVGKGKHMKLRLGQNSASLSAIAFGFGEDWNEVLNEGDLIDIVYEVSVNEWQTHRNVQLKIVDIKAK